jgi:hypothetical protein
MTLTGFVFRTKPTTGLQILAEETLKRVSYEKIEQKVKNE